MSLRQVARFTRWNGTTEDPVTRVDRVNSATTTQTPARWSFYVDDVPRPPLTLALNGAPANPVVAGDTVTITATPTGGIGPYAYTIAKSANAPTPTTVAAGKWTAVVPAETASGTTFDYTVTVVDSSAPPRSASAAYSVGVVPTTPPPPPPSLTVSLAQSPINPVDRGTLVTLIAKPTGGTAPFSYAFTRPAGAPALSGAGATRTFTVPSTAVDGTTYAYSVTVTDAASPAQSASAFKTARVAAPTTVRSFAGKKPQPRIGMSSPEAVWSTRFTQVAGANRLTARRIFSDLDGSAQGFSKAGLVNEAIADGLMPIVSFKDGSPTGPTNIAAATRMADFLKSRNVPLTISYWHEPQDNFIGADSAVFVQKQKQYMPLFKAPLITRCPIMNGWLVDNKTARLTEFCPNELFDGDYWECYGYDTYQAGATIDTPQRPWPGDRLPRMQSYLTGRGYGNWQSLIGEYNGWEGVSIADIGEKVLSLLNDNGEPQIWLAMMWNATTGKGVTLDTNPTYGNRLGAFKGTLSDSRVWKPEDPGETVP